MVRPLVTHTPSPAAYQFVNDQPAAGSQAYPMKADGGIGSRSWRERSLDRATERLVCLVTTLSDLWPIAHR